MNVYVYIPGTVTWVFIYHLLFQFSHITTSEFSLIYRFGNTQGSEVTSLLHLTLLESGVVGFEPTSKLFLTPAIFYFYSAYGHTSLGTHVGTSCDT